MQKPEAMVIGGGLAGSEAAWQLARRGIGVRLVEMRPGVMTPAHRTGDCGELVCSNSLKSENPASAPYLLKEELRLLDSLLLQVAGECRVPAGQALAVDRELFARRITALLEAHPAITVEREEVRAIPDQRPVILASGPLTSDALAADLARAVGQDFLYFYDAISPIVQADSIDRAIAFPASRYDRGGGDYLNCPFDKEEYLRFHAELLSGARHPGHEFEQMVYFEGCLPVEELARRGVDTLRFGPMKPVGLTDPRTGRRPYAAIQLRLENVLAGAYNLVGFQTQLRYGEQERVFRMIPGLAKAVFLRLGQIHRNTYVNAPRVLTPFLELRAAAGVFVAGQLGGLEGYVEAIATGLLAALQAIRFLRGQPFLTFPRQTALGSLQHWLGAASPDNYQPVNITFALLPSMECGSGIRREGKKARHAAQVAAALGTLRDFLDREGLAQR